MPIILTGDCPSSSVAMSMWRLTGRVRQAATDRSGRIEISHELCVGRILESLIAHDYPTRRSAFAWRILEMREIAATITLDKSCMVATSRSSNAPGEDERTSNIPSVRR